MMKEATKRGGERGKKAEYFGNTKKRRISSHNPLLPFLEKKERGRKEGGESTDFWRLPLQRKRERESRKDRLAKQKCPTGRKCKKYQYSIQNI